jgi:hypothetical protein
MPDVPLGFMVLYEIGRLLVHPETLWQSLRNRNAGGGFVSFRIFWNTGVFRIDDVGLHASGCWVILSAPVYFLQNRGKLITSIFLPMTRSVCLSIPRVA